MLSLSFVIRVSDGCGPMNQVDLPFLGPVYGCSFFVCADVASTGNPPLAERRAAVADWFVFVFIRRTRIDCGLRFVRVAIPMRRWAPILGSSTEYRT